MTVGESEPLDCDEAAYAYIGHRILQGDVMYRDLTENKPPLGYWIYTMAVAVGGYRELAIRLMAIPLVLATIAVVWWIAGRLGGPVAACLAAGLISCSAPTRSSSATGRIRTLHQPLRGPFPRPARRRLGPREPLVDLRGGGLPRAAALVKQVAIVHAMVFVPALCCGRGFRSGRPRRWAAGSSMSSSSVWDRIVVAIAAAIVLAGGAGGPRTKTSSSTAGHWRPTPCPSRMPRRWLVRWLTGNADPRANSPGHSETPEYLVWWGSGSWPLWLASVPALAYLIFARPTDARRLLAAGWTRGLGPGHPPGPLLAALLSAADPRAWRSPSPSPWRTQHRTWLAVSIRVEDRPPDEPGRLVVAACSTVALLAAIGGTLFIQARDYLGVAPEQLTIRYKGGRQWVVLRAMGRDLARRATIWDHPHLYVWGWQSPLNFYGRMDSPTRHFFVDNLLRDQADRDHPLIAPRTDEIMATLRRQPPELIFAGYAPFKALHAFLNESYLPSRLGLHDDRTGIGLWIRRDVYGSSRCPAENHSRSGVDADEHLAEVLAAQEPDQGARGVLQAVDDVLAVLDAAVADQRADLGQEIRLLAGEVEHDEAAERQSFDQDLAHEQRDAIDATRQFGRIVMRDQPADGHAGERVEERQDRVEDGTADVLEVDVDSLRAGGLERLGEIRPAVVDAGVEPELVDDVAAFLLAAGDADRPAALESWRAGPRPSRPRPRPRRPRRSRRPSGWPMFIRPVQAVIPGIPSTPSAVVMGARLGSSLRTPRPSDSAYSCQPV